jgi:hypothetical protein
VVPGLKWGGVWFQEHSFQRVGNLEQSSIIEKILMRHREERTLSRQRSYQQARSPYADQREIEIEH